MTTQDHNLSDTELQADVIAELDWEPSVNAANVGVTVKGGVVTLKGTVDSYAEKLMTEKVVRRMTGVRALADGLKGKLPGSRSRTDGDLARAAANALEWSQLTPHEDVKITVEHGHVTLDGKVNWDYQRSAAERAVEHLTGVTYVTNRITVNPTVKPGDVKAEIDKAFKRNAEIDAQKVRIEVDGSKVILTGSVHSWAEREAAAQAARSAPGVSWVDDRLALTWV